MKNNCKKTASCCRVADYKREKRAEQPDKLAASDLSVLSLFCPSSPCPCSRRLTGTICLIVGGFSGIGYWNYKIMAAGVARKISAASARAHTRKSKQKSFPLPSGWSFSFYFCLLNLNFLVQIQFDFLVFIFSGYYLYGNGILGFCIKIDEKW